MNIAIITLAFIFTLRECNGSTIECPAKCKCTTIATDCSGNQFDILPESINIEVGALDLSRNDFTTVPNISGFTSLERLSLRRNRINALANDSLRGMDNLKELDLSENCFKRYSDIHAQALQSAKSILHLDLSHNVLTSFPDLRSSSLEKLDLTNCSLKSIGSAALDGLPNLQALNIGGNQFQSINSLPSSATLIALNLTACDIQSVFWYTMDRLPALTHLYLARNLQLKTFNANSTSLTLLDLSDCNLESLPKCSMPNLRSLNLVGNHIRKVDAFSFVGMLNVQRIDLAYNSIDDVHKFAFVNASQLQDLDISHNTIRYIHTEIFAANTKLESVRLSRNYFARMIPFRSDSIIALDLRNCEIADINWKSLVRMSKLKDLNLSGNLFTSLPSNFTSTSLNRLHISNCRLTSLKNSSFQNAANIHYLDIAGNRLVEFQIMDFHSIRAIRIGDNPWRCDCDKKTFEYVYRYLIKIDSDVGNARCQTPEHLEGLTWFEACGDQWFDLNLNRNDKAWLVSLSLMMFFVIACCGYITINRECHKRRSRMSALERQNEARERLEHLFRRTSLRSDEEADTNAPDPRELQRPPSYNEAIAMPPLGSTASISSRKHEADDGLPKSVNNNTVEDGKQSKVKRKRRRKSPQRARQTSELSQASETSHITQSNPELSDKSVSSKSQRRRRRSASRDRERQHCDSSDSYVETDV